MHLGQNARQIILDRFGRRAEPHGAPSHPLTDDLVQALESTAADEEDVASIQLDHRLFGMLAPSLGRNIGNRSLDDLEQGLLHPFAGDVAADRRRSVLAGDLVHLVQIENALLGPGHIVLRGLQQSHQDVLHILADVARLGQDGGIGDGEGYLQHLGQGLCQQGLPGAGGADHHDIALFEFDAVELDGGTDPLVVVVDRHGQNLLGALLTDHVLLEKSSDLDGLGNRPGLPGKGLPLFLSEHLIAEFDALVADVYRGTFDDLVYLTLSAPAERTAHVIFGRPSSQRDYPLSKSSGPQLETSISSGGAFSTGLMISSIRPYSLAPSGLKKKSRSVSC